MRYDLTKAFITGHPGGVGERPHVKVIFDTAIQQRAFMNDLMKGVTDTNKANEQRTVADRSARQQRREMNRLLDQIAEYKRGQGLLVTAICKLMDAMVACEASLPESADYGGVVQGLGKVMGHGGLMRATVASWRAVLKEQGLPIETSYTVGPSYGTIQSALRFGRSALDHVGAQYEYPHIKERDHEQPRDGDLEADGRRPDHPVQRPGPAGGGVADGGDGAAGDADGGSVHVEPVGLDPRAHADDGATHAEPGGEGGARQP